MSRANQINPQGSDRSKRISDGRSRHADDVAGRNLAASIRALEHLLTQARAANDVEQIDYIEKAIAELKRPITDEPIDEPLLRDHPDSAQ